jgi:phage baseplate assembly protein gpV
MSLRLGRVVASNPQDNSVDLVMTDNGMRMPGVQVMAGTASTNTGAHDLPDPSTPASGDPWSLTEKTDRDMIAVCGALGGQLIVLGFLFPQICQMLFEDHNRRVNRHASDVYSTIDGKGNMELAHPSGFYMRVGTSPAHENLTGKDVDGKWKITKNTAQNVHFHLQMGGNKMSLNVAPNGDIDIDTLGKVVVNVSGTADITVDGNTSLTTPQLTVDSPQSTFTGKVTVQGLLTYTAGMSGSGSNPSGKAATIDGPMNFINSHGITTDGGDVVAGTISLKGHKHPETGGNTDPPIP